MNTAPQCIVSMAAHAVGLIPNKAFISHLAGDQCVQHSCASIPFARLVKRLAAQLPPWWLIISNRSRKTAYVSIGQTCRHFACLVITERPHVKPQQAAYTPLGGLNPYDCRAVVRARSQIFAPAKFTTPYFWRWRALSGNKVFI